MAMRKEYRPFNVEQARAGAPYGFIDDAYDVKIYEYFDKYCIGGVRKNSSLWRGDTWPYSDFAEIKMLPLFHCQGKPVYMGDTLYDANGSPFEVELSHTQSMIDECSWEVPKAKVETRMSNYELRCEFHLEPEFDMALRKVANSSIEQAIEDGDVVSKETIKEIVKFVHNLDVADAEVAWVHVDAAYFGD